MTPSEQAAFDELVAELDAALARLGEERVSRNVVFTIEPFAFAPFLQCVTARRSGSAELVFIPEGDWVRIDIEGLAECIELPLASDEPRPGFPSIGETLERLLVSRVSLTYRLVSTELRLTDPTGLVWGRNRHLGVRRPSQMSRGESREFSALFELAAL